jgi:hypothetical protein
MAGMTGEVERDASETQPANQRLEQTPAVKNERILVRVDQTDERVECDKVIKSCVAHASREAVPSLVVMTAPRSLELAQLRRSEEALGTDVPGDPGAGRCHTIPSEPPACHSLPRVRVQRIGHLEGLF